MRATIPLQSLRDAFGKVLSVVDKKNVRPILSNCLVDVQKNHMEISGTDLEVSVKTRIDASVESVGKFCISAKNILDILRELPEADVQIESDNSKSLININCNDIHYSLLVSSPDEFPQLVFEKNSNRFSVSADIIQDMIHRVSHAMSTDETRPFLGGIFLHLADSKLRAVACDGHRLVYRDALSFSGQTELLEKGIIVPRKGIAELKKLAEANPGREMFIAADDSFLYAGCDANHQVAVRLIAREYLRYQQSIPSKISVSMNAKKILLLDAVKRVRIMANEKSNGVHFTLRSNLLTIQANRPDIGEAKETIPIEFDGKGIDININARYIVDLVTVMEEEEISMSFTNELGPVIIRPKSNQDFFGLIMPLRP
jgi:DNA polymerase-3 subunit beta